MIFLPWLRCQPLLACMRARAGRIPVSRAGSRRLHFDDAGLWPR